MTSPGKTSSAVGRRHRAGRARPGQWQLQEAQARFSEVVRRAKQEGPQHVTVHGREEVVVKVRPLFAQRVLDVTEDVLFKWRLLVEEGRKSRHTFSQPDLFSAATALHHGVTVVSGDTREYERARVPVLNPWAS